VKWGYQKLLPRQIPFIHRFVTKVEIINQKVATFAQSSTLGNIEMGKPFAKGH
jgi:hypothetical protein